MNNIKLTRLFFLLFFNHLLMNDNWLFLLDTLNDVYMDFLMGHRHFHVFHVDLFMDDDFLWLLIGAGHCLSLL